MGEMAMHYQQVRGGGGGAAVRLGLHSWQRTKLGSAPAWICYYVSVRSCTSTVSMYVRVCSIHATSRYTLGEVINRPASPVHSWAKLRCRV